MMIVDNNSCVLLGSKNSALRSSHNDYSLVVSQTNQMEANNNSLLKEGR